jgi:hypothetical protein
MQHCSKQNVTAKPLHIFCSTAANLLQCHCTLVAELLQTFMQCHCNTFTAALQHIYSGTAKKLAVAGK